MVYLTGDMHGNFDRIIKFCKLVNTSKEDIMIILGDAGVNYYMDSRDVFWKQCLESLPITLLCIHGNYEQRPFTIPSYREVEWQGGVVYQELPVYFKE